MAFNEFLAGFKAELDRMQQEQGPPYVPPRPAPIAPTSSRATTGGSGMRQGSPGAGSGGLGSVRGISPEAIARFAAATGTQPNYDAVQQARTINALQERYRQMAAQGQPGVPIAPRPAPGSAPPRAQQTVTERPVPQPGAPPTPLGTVTEMAPVSPIAPVGTPEPGPSPRSQPRPVVSSTRLERGNMPGAYSTGTDRQRDAVTNRQRDQRDAAIRREESTRLERGSMQGTLSTGTDRQRENAANREELRQTNRDRRGDGTRQERGQMGGAYSTGGERRPTITTDGIRPIESRSADEQMAEADRLEGEARRLEGEATMIGRDPAAYGENAEAIYGQRTSDAAAYRDRAERVRAMATGAIGEKRAAAVRVNQSLNARNDRAEDEFWNEPIASGPFEGDSLADIGTMVSNVKLFDDRWKPEQNQSQRDANGFDMAAYYGDEPPEGVTPEQWATITREAPPLPDGMSEDEWAYLVLVSRQMDMAGVDTRQDKWFQNGVAFGLEVLDAPRAAWVTQAGDYAYETATGADPSILETLASVPGMAVGDFNVWAADPLNAETIQVAYEGGYNGYEGGRAVWERWVGEQNRAQRILLDIAMDPLNYLAIGGGTGAVLRRTGQQVARTSGTRAGRISGRAIEGVGRGLQLPEQILDKPVDAAISGIGRALGINEAAGMARTRLGRMLSPKQDVIERNRAMDAANVLQATQNQAGRVDRLPPAAPGAALPPPPGPIQSPPPGVPPAPAQAALPPPPQPLPPVAPPVAPAPALLPQPPGVMASPAATAPPSVPGQAALPPPPQPSPVAPVPSRAVGPNDVPDRSAYPRTEGRPVPGKYELSYEDTTGNLRVDAEDRFIGDPNGARQIVAHALNEPDFSVVRKKDPRSAGPERRDAINRLASIDGKYAHTRENFAVRAPNETYSQYLRDKELPRKRPPTPQEVRGASAYVRFIDAYVEKHGPPDRQPTPEGAESLNRAITLADTMRGQIDQASRRGIEPEVIARDVSAPDATTPIPEAITPIPDALTPVPGADGQSTIPGAQDAMRPVFSEPNGLTVPPQNSAPPPLVLQRQVLETPAAQRQEQMNQGQTDLFAEPAPASAPTPDTASNTAASLAERMNLEEVPIANISTDEVRFQARDELDRERAERIGANWDDDVYDAIIVWRDPTDGRDYVLDGHHRLTAAQFSNRDDLIVRRFEGSERKARAFARRINDKGENLKVGERSRNMLSDYEDQIAEGMTPTQARAYLKQQYKGFGIDRGMNIGSLPLDLRREVDAGRLKQGNAARIGQAIRDEVMTPADAQAYYYSRMLGKDYTEASLESAITGYAQRKQALNITGAVDMFAGTDLAAPQVNAVFERLEQLGTEVKTLSTQRARLEEVSGYPDATAADIRSNRKKVKAREQRIAALNDEMSEIGRQGAGGPSSGALFLSPNAQARANAQRQAAATRTGMSEIGNWVNDVVDRIDPGTTAQRADEQGGMDVGQYRDPNASPSRYDEIANPDNYVPIADEDKWLFEMPFRRSDSARGMTPAQVYNQSIADVAELRDLRQAQSLRSGRAPSANDAKRQKALEKQYKVNNSERSAHDVATDYMIDRFLEEAGLPLNAPESRNAAARAIGQAWRWILKSTNIALVGTILDLPRRAIFDMAGDSLNMAINGQTLAVPKQFRYIADVRRAQRGEAILDTPQGQRLRLRGVVSREGVYTKEFIRYDRDLIREANRIAKPKSFIRNPNQWSRDWVNALDSARRMAIADGVWQREVSTLENDALGLLVREAQVARSRITPEQWQSVFTDRLGMGVRDFDHVDVYNAVRSKALTDVQMNPETAHRLADRVAREYQTGVKRIHKQSIQEVNRSVFKYEYTSADELFSNFLAFHYYQTRALKMYVEQSFRHPAIASNYYRAMEGIERWSEEQNVPPALSGFLRLMKGPFGLALFVSPTAFFDIFNGAMFQATEFGHKNIFERLLDSPFWPGANVPLSTVINLAGWTPNALAPDPTGTSAERQLVTAGLNWLRGEFMRDPGIIGDPIRDATGALRETISGVESQSSTGHAESQVNQLLIDEIEQETGREWTNWTPMDRARYKKAANNPDAPAYQRARRRWGRGSFATEALQITSSMRPTTRVVSGDEVRDEARLPENGGTAPTRERQQNAALIRDIMDSGSPAAQTLVGQRDEYRNLTYLDDRGYQDDVSNPTGFYNQLLFDEAEWDLTIGEDTYTAAQLNAMTHEERKVVVRAYMDEVGLGDDLEAAWDVQAAYREANPAYREYHEWSGSVRDYEGPGGDGPEGYWNDVREVNPNAARYYDDLVDRNGDDIWEQSLTSTDAYLAVQGERVSVYDANPAPTTDTDRIVSDPATMAGYGAEADTGGGGGPAQYTPKTPEDNAEAIIKDLAEYEADVELMDMVVQQLAGPGARYDNLTPGMQRAVDANLDAMGLTPPRPSSRATAYLGWRQEDMDAGGDGSVIRFVLWQDEQEAIREAEMGPYYESYGLTREGDQLPEPWATP